MFVSLDHQQAVFLRELLEGNLKELRIESARADSHDFREMLHHREAIVEQLLSKLSEESHAVVS